MTKNSEFEDFSINFHDQVKESALAEDESRENKFTEFFLNYLEEFDQISNPFICYHHDKRKNIKINGYSINEDENSLCLFISKYSGDGKHKNISENDCESYLEAGLNFFSECINEYYKKIPEAQPVFDLAYRIYNEKDRFLTVNLYLITDLNISDDINNEYSYGNMEITQQTWDLNKIFSKLHLDVNPKKIIINFQKEFDEPIKCLTNIEESPLYDCYLAIIPAPILVKIYEKYGPRILERNIRSFLSVRGSVNKGIQKTISSEPHMFLAYNNGLSTTALSVNLTLDKNNNASIVSLQDFQIVNGAQTTASLYEAYKNNGNNYDKIEKIFVPVKISVIKNQKTYDTIVTKISQYSNSQNTINIADFSANNPYHKKLESLSRKIFVPLKNDTHQFWYYERSRGQYLVERNLHKNIKVKKLFDQKYPKEQKFSKTDLAKFINTWEKKPYLVSRGNQKNYQEFIANLLETENEVVDEKYYKDLISKAIIFKKTEKIIANLKFGGYNANIVTYSIAAIAEYRPDIFNLNQIWERQNISEDVEQKIQEISRLIYSIITNPPEGKNITEWCKKEECWINILSNSEIKISLCNNKKTCNMQYNITAVTSVAELIPECWWALSHWAKENNLFTPKDRSMFFNIGKIIAQNKIPSDKQNDYGLDLLKLAADKGFPFESKYFILKPKSQDPLAQILIDSLKELGGTAKIKNILDNIIKKIQTTPEGANLTRSQIVNIRKNITSKKDEFINTDILSPESDENIWKLN